MSLYAPVDREEVARSGWVFVSFLVGAPLLQLIFWWQVYFSPDTLVQAWGPATVLGLVLTWLTYRRSVRLVALGLHPYVRRGRRLPVKNIVASVVMLVAICWAWVLVACALSTLPGTRVQDRAFTVAVVEHCTRKCSGCDTRVRFSDWPDGGDPRVCARALDPRVGEKLVVRGRFGDRVRFLQGIGRAGS